MKYTTLGKTGLRVSRLGFGCMRLPMTPDGRVNRDLAVPLLRRAVELGINYFDTAIFYCNGDSQRTLGEAMEGIRDRVVLSTKNHLHEAAPDAWRARLEESLKSLRTPFIDVYNLHGMSWDAWVKHIEPKGGKLELLRKAKEEGLIKHICCSFHDTPEALVKLADTGVFESVTLQYNLLDRRLEPAIAHCRELGMGVVVMGPVGGGRLGVESSRIRELTSGDVESTPEAAFRFVLANPGVTVALSGMSDVKMLEDNVRIVSEKAPFAPEQVARLDAEIQRVKSRLSVQCPACGYCQPCPHGVDIPGNFAVLNEYRIYGLEENARRAYAGLLDKAALCTECGACLAKCPQKIEIPNRLREVVQELDKDFAPFGALMSVQGVRPDGTVRAQVILRNTGREPVDPVVAVTLGNGVRCEPAEFRPGMVRPGAVSRHSVDFLLPDGAGILDGKVVTTARETTQANPFHTAVLIAPRDHMRWHTPEILPSHFGGNAEIARTHGYRLGLRHDDARVLVQVEIRSQLHSLAKPGEAGGSRIELYVDMRPPKQGFATAPYTDGAEQFLMSIGEAGYGTKSGRKYDIVQRNTRTADGVRVEIELPFKAFIKPEWPIPSVIGLDLMFAVAGPDGAELGYPTYGGRGGLWQNPRLFTRAWLL